jgi:acyl-CoA reductase-like NAD-dependent aldehyde dehydrogenase
LLIKVAIGVCAFITPWNLPLHQIVAKVAPALAAGCTMILKPSSETPLTALYFAGLVAEVGLPPGVFNLVTGSGKVVGEAMAMHPDIDMVSITGSTSAGIRVAELAASTVKRVSQELGGKSACIVLDDADLDLAVDSVVRAVCMNSGQVCAALTRLILPRAEYKKAIAIAKMTVESVVVGGAFDDGVYMGPMVSRLQQETVRTYIKKGIKEGATLVAGGVEMPNGISKAFFVKPTVFADVKNDMIIAQEEIFGPVLVLIPYDSEAEAIEIANESIFGLFGAVWGKDVDRAMKVATKMRTGQVTINNGEFNLSAPFGGYKQSGNGRELGVYGLHEFMEMKSLQL